MNKLFETLGLRSPDGREAQLVSVQVHGEVLGLMLRLSIRQTWRNTSGAPMATRLAFALAPDQCLLELKAERNSGAQAVTTVSRLSRQVCSAGFGTMNTGEQVTLHWRIGQWLHVQGGSLRLHVPAAMVPPALRPAQLSFEVHDPAARGTPGSTWHGLQKVRHAKGMTFNLRAAHGLDKDFSLTLHGLRETGFALASPNPSRPGQCTVLASHSLQLGPADAPQRLRLKLAVDHTGALGAERQAQIQTALERLLGSLQPGDQLSCSRVGAALVHELPRLQPCTEPYVRRARSLLRHTEAEPGEPHWSATLQALVDIRDEDEEPVQDASVLLVTAQPIAATAEALQALRSAGHRLHVLAVGEAASQSFWPVLAQASGGSCEVLGHGQPVQQALQRLIDRMRSLRPVQAQLSIQGQTLAARQEHASMAEGDTLHVWADHESPQTLADLAGPPGWQAQLQWQASDEASRPHSAKPMPVLWDASGDLARVCAMRQVAAMPLGPERDQLIAQYALLLPDERQLRMPQASSPVGSAGVVTQPPTAQTSAPAPAPSPALAPATVHALRHAAPRAPTSGHPLAALVHQFNQQAPAYKQFRAALSATLQRSPTRTVDALVMQLSRQAGNPGRVWALLLYCVHAEHDLTLQGHALQLVEQELASVPLGLRNDLHASLAACVMPTAARAAA